jgi:hypothetical protein
VDEGAPWAWACVGSLCCEVKAQFSGTLQYVSRGAWETCRWEWESEPVLRVVRFLEGVADAGVAGSKDAVAFAGGAGRVEVEVHQLVHVAQDQHVAVELDDAVILLEGEGRQLAPAVVEARVVCVVLGDLGQQVGDVLLGNAAGIEGGVALCGEGVGVEGDERVL